MARRSGKRVMDLDAHIEGFIPTPDYEKAITQVLKTKIAPDYREQAISRTPFKTGGLRTHTRPYMTDKMTINVRPNPYRLAPHAHLLEFGVKPHIIRAKRKPNLGLAPAYPSVVFHPGIKARPFIRPTFKANEDKWEGWIIQAITDNWTEDGIEVG